MKKSVKWPLFSVLGLLLVSCSTFNQRQLASDGDESNIQVYMSPTQGKEAFQKMYEMITEAKEDVNITVYSWSDSGFTKALRSTLEKPNPPKVRVVLKKSLFKKHANTIAQLEKKGAMFKSAKIELHEKFILVDGKSLVNSSANMSSGAKNKYSENFIFFDAENESPSSDIKSLIKDFKQEFAIIWNSAHDHITPDELFVADVLNHKTKRKNKSTALKNIFLLSSSMNYKVTAPRNSDFKKGSVIGLKRIPNKANQIWTVKDAIIKAIDNAKDNINLNINHFNLKDISDALIRAVQRGVNVRLAVDSQEFKTYLNGKEMTPQFVEDFEKLKGLDIDIPVRVKFYSFVPHHSSWSLNHHKSILIDYNQKDGKNTVLLSGSYNYSKTAEHSKFDNQVVIKGDAYKSVYKAFYEEFQYLWNLERDQNDQPRKKMTDYFKKERNNLIPLHSNIPFSLSWKEARKLKREINTLYPESRTFYKFKKCQYFSPKSKKFFKRDGKTACQ